MLTAYDTVIYPNMCQSQTHPDRLAVVANLFGLVPAPPEHCRVLEVGCGGGNNLLPLAWANPDSKFTGFDLADTRIQVGLEATAQLGLTNLELRACDILDFPLEGEPFDYVIAHGVYSWIPREARDRLLEICRRRLAPQGVAYISYNCLPGCHLRRLPRDIMRFHVRTVQDPLERVRQAMAVCQFIANSIDKPDTYRQLFKDQLEQIQRHGAGHLFHDDLAEINDPVYFHEFAAHAAQHRLQYLGEADFFEMQDDAFSDDARQILARMEDSRLTREQYLDFVKCRRFRQTLLCHVDIPLRYPADSSAIEHFQLSSQAQHSAKISPDGRPIERFVHTRGGALEIGHPLGIRALSLLAERWPETHSFSDLFLAASAGEPKEADAQENARTQLREILLEAYRAGIVEFHRTPVRCVAKPSDRPTASRFARWQLARSSTVTTLRGENLQVEDELGKRLLQLLDGTRTRPELEMELGLQHSTDPEQEDKLDGRLAKRLQELAGLALLET